MNKSQRQTPPIVIPLGVGSYTAAEAGRLVGVPSRTVNRWLKGYTFRHGDGERRMEPLWRSQLAMIDDHLELGFRDLVELRFVKAFVNAGLGLLAIRNCLEHARRLVDDERPFSTRRFKTDGRTIFIESIDRSTDATLLDLKSRQYVLGQLIEKSFKDLDIDNEVVSRWRPYKGKDSIVIDPERAFGQPIAADSGVPVIALADAVEAEGSIDRVSRLYRVTPAVVRDAVRYHASLQKVA